MSTRITIREGKVKGNVNVTLVHESRGPSVVCRRSLVHVSRAPSVVCRRSGPSSGVCWLFFGKICAEHSLEMLCPSHYIGLWIWTMGSRSISSQAIGGNVTCTVRTIDQKLFTRIAVLANNKTLCLNTIICVIRFIIRLVWLKCELYSNEGVRVKYLP